MIGLLKTFIKFTVDFTAVKFGADFDYKAFAFIKYINSTTGKNSIYA